MNTITGEEIQTAAAQTLNVDFAALIALSAIWAPAEAHEACHDGCGGYASVPNCKRKRHNEPRGEVNGVIYDDNSRANSKMKAMVRKYYGVRLEEFTVCHVWPDTCYDVRYHTCLANLVYIPAAIHSLTDYDAHVEACLKYRAYELFGWKPEEEMVPVKPDNYPAVWLELPRCEASCKNTTASAQKCTEAQDAADCAKALSRLEGVWTDDSLVHGIIQRALELGCTDETPVYVDDLTVGDFKRLHIASMKTERGNSYGRYFAGVGRGEDAQVYFVPQVWRQLKALGWAK
jgi:hypothetical protein